MTDAHCHVSCGDPAIREFLIGRDFIGIHPWETIPDTSSCCRTLVVPTSCSTTSPSTPTHSLPSLRSQLLANPSLGVGEIGLDRLKVRTIPDAMRDLFTAQLSLALSLHRPIVLHGAKCWGQVVSTIRSLLSPSCCRTLVVPTSCATTSPSPALTPHSSFLIPHSSFLFHGFSRSDGLIPDIIALNGYISVGPAILNDHAVNYRELVKKIPLDRLLVETDRTPANAATCPPISAILAKLATILSLPLPDLITLTDHNATTFLHPSP